jgi:hypothetical protein
VSSQATIEGLTARVSASNGDGVDMNDYGGEA